MTAITGEWSHEQAGTRASPTTTFDEKRHPMTRHEQIIMIQPLAPAHPGVGQPCNGCGLCCLWQPCPVGVVVTRSRQGPCRALVWSAELSVYRCGLLTTPRAFVPWLPAAVVRRLTRRWIAANTRCDADLLRSDVDPGGDGAA